MILFFLVNKFSSEGDAIQAYAKVWEYFDRLQKDEYPFNLAVRPFELNKEWHVIVSGFRPARHIEEQIDQYLSSGKHTALPLYVLELLLYRQALVSDGWLDGWRRGPSTDHD